MFNKLFDKFEINSCFENSCDRCIIFQLLILADFVLERNFVIYVCSRLSQQSPTNDTIALQYYKQ